ncbi:MAG TPA: inositol monophosphatase family protein, partial [Acidimicrobiales bacterium]|nr:inositol monophosphatase family protein [Acidimicrobiales bacterium]
MRDDHLLEVLHEAATAVRRALDGLADWGDARTQPGQYLSDLAADEAALLVLDAAGLGAMSEESGLHHGDRPIVVVIDPVDGSTNASRGLPWYATSLCAVDADGARVALVVDQASGSRFDAVRGGGARVDGAPLTPSGVTEVSASMLGLSGLPPRDLGWKQFRTL